MHSGDKTEYCQYLSLLFHSPFSIPEVTVKSNSLSSELKEEKSSLKKLKADFQQLQDDLSETKAEKEAAERVRNCYLLLSFFT